MQSIRHIIILLATLLLPILLRAQNDWDTVLDRYEQICSSCIELRDRISHGESVPDAIVTELLGEWAKVTDFSWSGIGAETGITFTFKHIDIMAGTCWMGGFSFLLGIGYAF